MPIDERCLRRMITQVEEETLVHQASRTLRDEALARATRRCVELTQAARDKSAARVARLFSRLEAEERRSTARDAGIVARRERLQALGPSVLRVGFRVGLVVGLFVLLFERASLAALLPLLALWVALLTSEDV